MTTRLTNAGCGPPTVPLAARLIKLRIGINKTVAFEGKAVKRRAQKKLEMMTD
jgi:hypothetical protein